MLGEEVLCQDMVGEEVLCEDMQGEEVMEDDVRGEEVLRKDVCKDVSACLPARKCFVFGWFEPY